MPQSQLNIQIQNLSASAQESQCASIGKVSFFYIFSSASIQHVIVNVKPGQVLQLLKIFLFFIIQWTENISDITKNIYACSCSYEYIV